MTGLVGCSTKTDPLACVDQDCSHQDEKTFCDVNGVFTELKNECIVPPSADVCNRVETCPDGKEYVCSNESMGVCVECLIASDCRGGVCNANNECESDGRVEEDLIALYTFDTEIAGEIADVSGFGTPLDLAVVGSGDYEVTDDGWLLRDDTLISSKRPAQKIVDELSNTNAFSIEAWVRPTSTDQRGPARIVCMSESPNAYNFTLGQGGLSGDQYVVRVRTATTDDSPEGILTEANLVTTEWTHLVFTRAANETVTLYVDGQAEALTTIGNTPNIPGALDNWDSTYLNLGDELQSSSGQRSWLGEYALVAIYRRALERDEVTQNYDAGR
jgi:hypothetical protein